MRILVTGATGFIGSYLVEKLVADGHDVACMIRKTSDTSHLDSLGVEKRTGDLGHPPALQNIAKNIEVVYHLAAYYTFLGKKELYDKYNVQGTRALLHASENAGVTQFIYCSSAEAIGLTPIAKDPSEYASEDAPYNPQFEYGRSKMRAEQIVMQSTKTNWTIIRPTGVYGPRNLNDIAFWLVEAIAKHKLSVWFRVRNSGTVHFSHVHDIVQGLDLARKKEAYNQIFNIGSDKCQNTDEVVKLIHEFFGKKPPRLALPKYIAKTLVSPIQLFNNLRGKPDFFLQMAAIDSLTGGRNYSNRKAKEILGFNPEYDIQRGMAETITWYQEQGIL